MVNCIEYLTKKGFNMNGYSPDTVYYLSVVDLKKLKDPEECVSLLWWLEGRYG